MRLLGVSASERRLALRAIHERARGLRSRHPIVRGVFVVDAEGVFYPALEGAVQDDVATVATREASSDDAGASGDASAVHLVLRRFETAERDELIADRLEPALAGRQGDSYGRDDEAGLPGHGGRDSARIAATSPLPMADSQIIPTPITY